MKFNNLHNVGKQISTNLTNIHKCLEKIFLEALASLELGIVVTHSQTHSHCRSHFWSLVPNKTIQDLPGIPKYSQTILTWYSYQVMIK